VALGGPTPGKKLIVIDGEKDTHPKRHVTTKSRIAPRKDSRDSALDENEGG